MKYYTAIPVPPHVSTALSAVRGQVEGARWMNPADYHITLAYLGELESKEVATVKDILAQPNTLPWERRPLHITYGGLGIFRNHPENVLYASIANHTHLERMHLLHKSLLSPYLRSTHQYPQYTPHITLAYLPPRGVGQAMEIVGKSQKEAAGNFTASHVNLYGWDETTAGQKLIGSYTLA